MSSVTLIIRFYGSLYDIFVNSRLGRGVDMAAATTPGAHPSPHTFRILLLVSSRYFVLFRYFYYQEVGPGRDVVSGAPPPLLISVHLICLLHWNCNSNTLFSTVISTLDCKPTLI